MIVEASQRVTARRTLLFLSADLIGSTLYKHKSLGAASRQQAGEGHGVTPWLTLLKKFFVDFSGEVILEICKQTGLSVSIWKLLGDEIIFTVEVQSGGQVAGCVEAFTRVMQNWDENCTDHDPSLGIKGCVWIADFPYPNITLPLGLLNPAAHGECPSGKPASREDYVGPQMDCAFRMARLASREYLIVSVEVAYCLISHTGPQLTVLFKQVEDFKGVPLQGGYPVFEIPSVLNPYTRSLLDGRVKQSDAVLMKICRSFFESSEFFKCPNFPDLPATAHAMGFDYDHPKLSAMLQAVFSPGMPGDDDLKMANPSPLQDEIFVNFSVSHTAG